MLVPNEDRGAAAFGMAPPVHTPQAGARAPASRCRWRGSSPTVAERLAGWVRRAATALVDRSDHRGKVVRQSREGSVSPQPCGAKRT